MLCMKNKGDIENFCLQLGILSIWTEHQEKIFRK